MTVFSSLPDDWTPLPQRLLKSPNVALLIAAKAVEVRGEGDRLEWRRRPIVREADNG